MKGYGSILGNDIVNTLAKEAIKLDNLINHHYKNVVNIGRKESRIKRKIIWKNFVESSNNHYIPIHPSWDYKVTKAYSIAVTRLKLNHEGFLHISIELLFLILASAPVTTNLLLTLLFHTYVRY